MRVDSLLKMEVNVDGVKRTVHCERCWGEGERTGKYYRVSISIKGFVGKVLTFTKEEHAIAGTKTITNTLNDVLSEARKTYSEVL